MMRNKGKGWSWRKGWWSFWKSCMWSVKYSWKVRKKLRVRIMNKEKGRIMYKEVKIKIKINMNNIIKIKIILLWMNYSVVHYKFHYNNSNQLLYHYKNSFQPGRCFVFWIINNVTITYYISAIRVVWTLLLKKLVQKIHILIYLNLNKRKFTRFCSYRMIIIY